MARFGEYHPPSRGSSRVKAEERAAGLDIIAVMHC